MSDTIIATITCLLFLALGYIHGYDDGDRRSGGDDYDD
jgi:hypothetical protein